MNTPVHGFFNATFINLEVSKSSPNRKGKVIGVEHAYRHTKKGKEVVIFAIVQFRDFTQQIIIQ